MINVKCPCKDCEARRAGCHGSCEAYTEYRGKIAEVQIKRKELQRWAKPNKIPRRAKK